MADLKKIAPGNVEGDFFVDTTCISCGNCRDLAPATFSKHGKYYVVTKQPLTQIEQTQALDALVCCPLGSIGTTNPEIKKEIANSLNRFPQLIDDDVFYLGFNSASSFGGKSYFVIHPDGNWLIDSPKFSSRLVNFFKNHGGIKNIFLTHRDDVAQAAEYAAEFKSNRYIHKEDLEAQKDAEFVFDGIEHFNPSKEFTIIPTPGHTMGHSMLLYREKFLFSGDVFTSNTYSNTQIEAWPPYYCWGDWNEQNKSIARLLKFSFEYMLPSHGKRFHGTKIETKAALEYCLLQCQRENDPDPYTSQRAEMFDEIAIWARQTGQLNYADFASRKATLIRQKLGLEGN